MAVAPENRKKPKGLKHWLLFTLRWGIAVVGVAIVLWNMSIRDQAWVILNHQTNVPVEVALDHTVGEASPTYPVIDPATRRVIDVPREFVVNAPGAKTVVLRGVNQNTTSVHLLGVDLVGDINQNPATARLLVAADAKAGPAQWVRFGNAPGQVVRESYKPSVSYPRDQTGLASLIRGARPALLWLSLLVFPVTFIITSYRWHELLKPLDIHIGFARAFQLNMVGCFCNTFIPAGSTGGDAIKAYYVSKQTPWRTRAVMSVVIDRAVGLLALIVLGGTTAALQWEISACRKVAVASALICACVALGLSVFYVPALRRLSRMDAVLAKLPMQKQLKSAVTTMDLYGKRPGLALGALLMSLPVHGAVVLSAMFAGKAFGLPLHWAYYWVAIPVIVLAGAIPISPQGAGVMEGFAVLLTRPQGVTVSQAFALTMSLRVVQILWNLFGGLFYLKGGLHGPTEAEKRELDPGDVLPDGPGGEPAVAV